MRLPTSSARTRWHVVLWIGAASALVASYFAAKRFDGTFSVPPRQAAPSSENDEPRSNNRDAAANAANGATAARSDEPNQRGVAPTLTDVRAIEPPIESAVESAIEPTVATEPPPLKPTPPSKPIPPHGATVDRRDPAAPWEMPGDSVDDVVLQLNEPLVLKQPGEIYRLPFSLRFNGSGIYIAAPNVTLDLNGHTIYYGRDHSDDAHAVVLYVGWHNEELSIPAATDPSRARIVNGRIVHEGKGVRSHAIYGHRGSDASIEKMRVAVNGADSHTVWFTWHDATIADSVLISRATESLDRHAGPANVRVGNRLVATGNVLVGGNSGFHVGGGSRIERNAIAHDSHVTNGYGVFLYRNEDVTVADNLILPENGRGVLLNAGKNHRIVDNVILHLERPNSEFGDALNPPAVRARYDVAGGVVRGNTCLGIGGGDRTSASGLYLSIDGREACTFEKNSLTTIFVGAPDRTRYAQPITIERLDYDSPSQDAIRDNALRSNLYQIRISGYDGAAGDTAPMHGNALAWVDGDTARREFADAVSSKLREIGLDANLDAVQVARRAKANVDRLISGVKLSTRRAVWYAKDHSTRPARATLLNAETGPGVELDTYAYASLNRGEVAIRVGRIVNARLVSASGEPLSNAAVTVTTDRGDVYQLTTDQAGAIQLPAIEYGLEKPDEADAPIEKIRRTTTAIAVSGYTPLERDQQALFEQADAQAVVVLTLGESDEAR